MHPKMNILSWTACRASSNIIKLGQLKPRNVFREYINSFRNVEGILPKNISLNIISISSIKDLVGVATDSMEWLIFDNRRLLIISILLIKVRNLEVTIHIRLLMIPITRLIIIGVISVMLLTSNCIPKDVNIVCPKHI